MILALSENLGLSEKSTTPNAKSSKKLDHLVWKHTETLGFGGTPRPTLGNLQFHPNINIEIVPNNAVAIAAKAHLASC